MSRTKPKKADRPTRDEVPGFAAAVRTHRERGGWTQQQVDERAGLSPGTTAQIEGGHRSPSLRLALILSGAVGLSLDRFRDKIFTKS